MDEPLELIVETDDAPDENTRRDIMNAAQLVLERYGIHHALLSITLVDHNHIRELNCNYRGIDAATDILSFPQYDTLEEIIDDVLSGAPVHLGDLVLCLEEVRENCRVHFFGFDEELPRLIIHGMLHIIGKTHQSYDTSDPMLVEQEQLLAEYLDTRSTEN